ncbi:MAG: MarR family transcriptional regulator [Clostridia bacterium]|nr:MarR family transcriptional regulator [Clostridia bacterium]
MNSRTFFYELGKSLYGIDGFYAEYAKKFDVKENLLWILYALNDGEKHSQKEICDSWDLPRSTVNTIIKELEVGGYVFFSQIKGEKRELNVTLTKAGKKYAEELLGGLYEIEKRVFENFKTSDLLSELQRIREELYGQENNIKKEMK